MKAAARLQRRAALLCLALLAACSDGGGDSKAPDRPAGTNAAAPAAPLQQPAAPANEAAAPLQPPPPGAPGGLPNDRRPLAEGPSPPGSAGQAGQILHSYFALLEEHRPAQAYELWWSRGEGTGLSEAAFAARFAAYSAYHAQIGRPGPVEGAAGSSYVEIPVQVYGRLRSGAAFDRRGTIVLRRVNGVPGADPEDYLWRIYRSDLPPVTAPPAAAD